MIRVSQCINVNCFVCKSMTYSAVQMFITYQFRMAFWLQMFLESYSASPCQISADPMLLPHPQVQLSSYSSTEWIPWKENNRSVLNGYKSILILKLHATPLSLSDMKPYSITCDLSIIRKQSFNTTITKVFSWLFFHSKEFLCPTHNITHTS